MVDTSFEKLEKSVLKYNENADIKLLRKSYDLSKKFHGKQLRASGEPYFIHPFGVALILSEAMQSDVITLSGALLHDVLEDTDMNFDEMKEMFGLQIAEIVDGVTKLNKLLFKSKEEQQAENIRKMFLAMAKDVRVIIIKLADRLHNMRTLGSLPEYKQKRIAKETIDIYAPLAHRLGIHVFKWELEDLSIKYIEKKAYQDLKHQLKNKRIEREKEIDKFKLNIQDELKNISIDAEVIGRAKHFYSIYLKMIRQNKKIDEIYDLLGVRIICNSVRDCYAILGVIHKLYKPIPGRFKDYIAVPKSNMYQSLHTTVIYCGTPVEVQIRTVKMHEIAEMGIAAHWGYKEGKNTVDNDQSITLIRHLIDWHKEVTDAKEYIELLKYDLFTDEVFIFTPQGDIKNLKSGSTSLDFAYSIHTDVGNKFSGAKVNGKIIPMDYVLKSGDVVEILTSKNANPNIGWLDIATTPRAKSKVKQYLRKMERDSLIERGNKIFIDNLNKMKLEIKDDKLDNYDFSIDDFQYNIVIKNKEFLKFVNKKYNGINDFFVALQMNNVSWRNLIQTVFPSYTKYIVNKKKFEDIQKVKKKPVKSQSGVIVEGIDNCLINFAKCCNPVPGDTIIGYITRGKGISIHKRSCPNARSLLKDRERLITVKWDYTSISENSALFSVKLTMHVVDRPDMLFDLTSLVSDMKLNINSFKANKSWKSDLGTIEFIVSVRNSEQIDEIINRLSKINGVSKIFKA